MAQDAVSLYRRSRRLHTYLTDLAAPLAGAWPRIDIVPVHVGADDTAVRASIAVGARGLVVDGFSFRGLPAPGQRETLRRAVDDGLPVVLCNRGRMGRIPLDRASPYISADDLTAPKARILLALAVAGGVPPSSMQELFDRH